MMPLSPTNILSKLEELKKWQEKQQERLMEQHNKRLQNNSNLGAGYSNSENIFAEQGSEKSSPPFKGSAKEKLEEDDDRTDVTSKPKQPFLRRGAGLARFRMTPGQQLKLVTKNNIHRHAFHKKSKIKGSATKQSVENSVAKKPWTESVASKSKSNTARESGSSTKNKEINGNIYESKFNADKDAVNSNNKVQFKTPIITPLKKPDLSVKPKAMWYTTSDLEDKVTAEKNFDPLSSQNVSDGEEYQETNKSKNEPNIDASDQDLLIFEALEQRAMHNSFCSTNSSIVRLLSSTPNKKSPVKAQVNKNSVQFQSVYAQESDDATQVNYAQNFKHHKPVMEEIVEDESFKDNSTTLQSDTQMQINEFEKQLKDEYLSLIEKVLKFKQCVAADKTAYSSASSVTSEDVETTLQTEANFNDKNKWTDGDTCTTESSSASLDSSKVWQHEEPKCNAETMTEPILEDDSQNKLKELEAMLKSIHLENGKTNKLKLQVEQQQREFEKHKKEIIKQVEDDKVRINQALEEEKKKFAKEKMVFERYIKDLQNKPSRKEREEMAALKVEIATLKETLKLKETKNGMAQARLRNQIKSLEKENAALKDEVEALNKQNARFVVSQKYSRKPSDTKVLHQINKTLTKLTKEKLSKQKVVLSSDEDDHECLGKSVVKPINSNKSIANLFSAHLKPNMLEWDKENSKNTLNSIASLDVRQNVSSIEETYEQAFGVKNYEAHQRLSTGSTDEGRKSDQTEQTLSDGTKQIQYTNGNVKTISADGNHIVLKYYNGDIKETNLLEGTVRYHYYSSKVNHTTNADGTELIEFPDGQTERHLKDGVCEVQYSNGVVRRTRNSGIEEVSYPDGTTVTINADGERILQLPNGQKETHTSKHKRREYPDGTVKILYPDGLQETRYANGRVRLKDKNGKLLMDSQDSV